MLWRWFRNQKKKGQLLSSTRRTESVVFLLVLLKDKSNKTGWIQRNTHNEKCVCFSGPHELPREHPHERSSVQVSRLQQGLQRPRHKGLPREDAQGQERARRCHETAQDHPEKRWFKKFKTFNSSNSKFRAKFSIFLQARILLFHRVKIKGALRLAR